MDCQIFEKLSPTKLLFRCALPSMVTMLFGALYQIADGLFVGRFIGGDALAAVNLIMPIIMIAFALSDMFASGASVRISILLGESKRQEASRVFSSTLKIIFLVSCVAGAVGFMFAEPILRLLSPGANQKAIEYGITYIRVYSAFAPIMPIGFATDNFLRVCGKENLSMYISIFSQALNIVLDIILIAILHKGIFAAAFTSCISMAFASIVSLVIFRGKKLDLYYTKEGISFKTVWQILFNGSSEFFSNISMSIMSIVYNFFLLKYGGTVGVAAFSVIMYVDSIIGMLTFGVSSSLQPAISYLYGAGQIAKLKAVFRRIVASSVVLSAAAMLFMMLAGRYVAPLFVKPEDTELLAVSIVGIQLFSLSYITGWVDMCYSSFFTSLERPILSLLVSAFGTLVFPIIFLAIFTPYLKLNGVWLASVASCTASAILTVILSTKIRLKQKECI